MLSASTKKKSRKESPEIELNKKLVNIRRVSKTNKGGRTFGFSVLVVVGDGKGKLGFGNGKAKEIPEAVTKAETQAKKNMFYVPMLNGKTIHHDVTAKFGACRVIIRTASPGTGIIAGGAMRSLFEVSGIKDVVAKSISASSNSNNLVRATVKALQSMVTPKLVASFRDKRISEINARRKLHHNATEKIDDKQDIVAEATKTEEVKGE